jgi:hypothetical protein
MKTWYIAPAMAGLILAGVLFSLHKACILPTLLYRFYRVCGPRAYILFSGYRTFRRRHGQETLRRQFGLLS